MILTSVSSLVLILAFFLEVSPTSTTAASRSFDELLSDFMTVETSRKAAIKSAVELAANLKSNVTTEFLEFVRVADEALENIRRYFDAGKVMFDMNKGILNPGDPGFIAKTELLRNATFLKDELHRLAATYKTLEARVADLPREHYDMMRPVIQSIKQSEQALIPLGKKFQVDLDSTKPRPRTDKT